MSVSNETLRHWGQLSVHAVITSFFKTAVQLNLILLNALTARSAETSVKSTLGRIGEYIGKIYLKVKKRPLFIIKERHNITEEKK